mgnify:CR=1 FL=1
MKAIFGLLALFLLLLPAADTGSRMVISMVQAQVITRARAVLDSAATATAVDAVDNDADGILEPPPGAAGLSGMPGDMYELPTTYGIRGPWNAALGYCAWDHGSTTNPGRIAGVAVPTSEAAVAIVSAGPNGSWESSCASLPARTGDDQILVLSYLEARARRADYADNLDDIPTCNGTNQSARWTGVVWECVIDSTINTMTTATYVANTACDFAGGDRVGIAQDGTSLGCHPTNNLWTAPTTSGVWLISP